MSEEAVREQQIKTLIGSVPMQPGTVIPAGQPTVAQTPGGGQAIPAQRGLQDAFGPARQLCVICEAEIPLGQKPVHRLGCKFGPPVVPGRLTARVQCTECKSMGLDSDGVKLGHQPGCSRNPENVVPALDTCAWRIPNESDGGASARECGGVAMAVRSRRLSCAQHAAEYDKMTEQPRVATQVESVKAQAEAAILAIAVAENQIAKQGKALAGLLIQIAALAANKAAEAIRGDKPAATIGDLLSASHLALKLADDADRLGDKALARR